MRVAILGAMVDVTKNAEAEFWIFVQHLAVGHVVAEVRLYEILVLQHLLNERADLFPPFDTRVRLEDLVAFGGELLEIIAHQRPSLMCPTPARAG